MSYKAIVIGVFYIFTSCKETPEQINFIDDHKVTLQDLNSRKLYFFPADMIVYLGNPQNEYNSYPVNAYFTNVKPASYDSKIPTNIFTKDSEYFDKVLHKKYVFYYITKNDVKMRIVYFENNGKEQFQTLNDIYNYLKKRKIGFKLIREKKGIDGVPYADILLTKNSIYCKVKATKLESISNIYYNAKDTVSTIRYGNTRFFYDNR